MFNTFTKLQTKKIQQEIKGRVIYGRKRPRGESTTTECIFNFQLLALIY